MGQFRMKSSRKQLKWRRAEVSPFWLRGIRQQQLTAHTAYVHSADPYCVPGTVLGAGDTAVNKA